MYKEEGPMYIKGTPRLCMCLLGCLHGCNAAFLEIERMIGPSEVDAETGISPRSRVVRLIRKFSVCRLCT